MGKKSLLVKMSFIYFYLKISIYNIDILRIYLLLMEWFLWYSLEVFFNFYTKKGKKKVRNRYFLFQTFKQKWKREKILTISWQMTKIKTPTDRDKTTFLSPKKPNYYHLKNIPQPMVILRRNFILKLNLQQTYWFTVGRKGKSASSIHFHPGKKLLLR